jgi:hypothetical protein
VRPSNKDDPEHFTGACRQIDWLVVQPLRTGLSCEAIEDIGLQSCHFHELCVYGHFFEFCIRWCDFRHELEALMISRDPADMECGAMSRADTDMFDLPCKPSNAKASSRAF